MLDLVSSRYFRAAKPGRDRLHPRWLIENNRMTARYRCARNPLAACAGTIGFSTC
jgi:hypothetical protein